MTAILDSVIDCNSKWAAATAGFGVSFIGLDRVFGDPRMGGGVLFGLGLPPMIHWSLAGASIDNYCKNGNLIPMSWNESKRLGYAAAAGAGGGFAAKVVWAWIG